MALNLTQKLIKNHLVDGQMIAGQEIGIKIDQTLVHDATGQMALLQFEALGFPRVKTKRSLIYTDHNILQVGFENADDHAFLASCAQKFGLYYSRTGNGICHQVNLERFAVPGDTLLGADSHTTTGGAVAELAIGAGGLDVSVAMGGKAFYMPMPKVILIKLSGRLKPWVRAKDVALEMLRLLTVSGGRDSVLEFAGDGLPTLSVTERATIANMSIESGALTAVFPSDEETRIFLTRQERSDDYQPLSADNEAEYDQEISINLSELEPLIAKPHSPDNVDKVKNVAGVKLDQVAIGSCTNSSLEDMLTVANILKGKVVPAHLSLIIAPGSRQVFQELAKRDALSSFINAGARIMEIACGFCNGVGQAPKDGGVSLRTSNRNFVGRSGTKNAKLYLASPETAAVSALKGMICDPRDFGEAIVIEAPKRFLIDDQMIVPPVPQEESQKVKIIRGPNIAPLPQFNSLPDELMGEVMLTLADNITTDDILPAGAHILALRANIPAISEYIFSNIEADFPQRIKSAGLGFVIGGKNYGQGSSREHAALGPRYLGLRVVIAESFARIHKANLCNFGILPLEFVNANDRQKISKGDKLKLENLHTSLKGSEDILVQNLTNNEVITCKLNISLRLKSMLLAGGLLAQTKAKEKNNNA